MHAVVRLVGGGVLAVLHVASMSSGVGWWARRVTCYPSLWPCVAERQYGPRAVGMQAIAGDVGMVGATNTASLPD